MTFNFDSYYSRHFPLKSIGYKNQKILQTKTVLIAGVGGLGSVSSELLASYGIGKLILVDYDIIEQSNLARQKLYTLDDLGKPKIEIAKAALLRRNPSIVIEIRSEVIDETSVDKLLAGVDVVVDGLDRFYPRKFLHKACYNKKIPYVFAGAVGDTANIMTITFTDTSPCLVCAIGYPEDNPNATCATVGVNPALLGITGSIQANETIKLLLEQLPTLEGTMLYIDTVDLTFDKIQFTKRSDCPVCGNSSIPPSSKRIYETTIAGKIFVDNLCGNNKYIIKPKKNLAIDISTVEKKIYDMVLITHVSESAITFKYFEVLGNIMSSGAMTLQNVVDQSAAIELYSQIIKHIFKDIPD